MRLALLVLATAAALALPASPAAAFACDGQGDVPRFCTYVGIFNKSTNTFNLTETRASAGAWLGGCPPPLIGRNINPNSNGYFTDCAMGAGDAPGGSATGGATWATGTSTVALDFRFTPGDPPNSATLSCNGASAPQPFDCPYFQWNANDAAKPPPPDGFPTTSMRVYVHIYPMSHRDETPTSDFVHAASVSAARLARSGLPVAVEPSHGGRVTATLRPTRGARGSHGRASKSIPAPGDRHRLRVRLNRSGRRALRADPSRSYRLVLQVRSRFGKARTLVHRVRVR